MVTDTSHSVLLHLLSMTETGWVTAEQHPVIDHFHVDTAIVKANSAFGPVDSCTVTSCPTLTGIFLIPSKHGFVCSCYFRHSAEDLLLWVERQRGGRKIVLALPWTLLAPAQNRPVESKSSSRQDLASCPKYQNDLLCPCSTTAQLVLGPVQLAGLD